MRDKLRLLILYAKEDLDEAKRVLVEQLEVALRDLPVRIIRDETGIETPTTRFESVIAADIVVLWYSAHVWGDRDLWTLLMPCMVARHGAKEAVAIVVRAKPAELDARLRHTLVVPAEGGSLQTHAAAIRDVTEAVKHAALAPLQRRIHCESIAEQAHAEENRLEAWRCKFGLSRSAAVPSVHPLTPGALVRAKRVQLRKRVCTTPHVNVFDAYDFEHEREVWVHHVVDGMSDDGRLKRMLNAIHAIGDTDVFCVHDTLKSETDGSCYITERLCGPTLKAMIAEGSIERSAVLRGMIGIARCVAEAHERGVRHGRLDAEYIRLDVLGDGPNTRRLRLVWPVVVGDLAPLSDNRRVADDVKSFGELLLFCVHGAPLPPNIDRHKVEALLTAARGISVQLKALVARCISADVAGHNPMRAIVNDLRRALEDNESLLLALDMIAIAGGEFRMGRDLTGNVSSAHEVDRRAHPSRRVSVSPFLMSKYLISRRIYRKVMGVEVGPDPQDDLPITHVRHGDAIEWCNRASELCGLQPAYDMMPDGFRRIPDADGFRLATEAEWEITAGGKENRLWAWGNATPAHQASWNGKGNALGVSNRKGPSPQWSHVDGATPEGILHLSGNLWEWCEDHYRDYETVEGVLSDPRGPETSHPPKHRPSIDPTKRYRVLRGGSWSDEDPAWLQTFARMFDEESAAHANIGFRVVRTLFVSP